MHRAQLLLLVLARLSVTKGAALPADTTSSTVASPTIQLDYASYEGERYENGVDAYLGMRYAAPPVGALRFSAPEDPLTETEIQEATAVSIIEFLCEKMDNNSQPTYSLAPSASAQVRASLLAWRRTVSL
jgi:hypothetical protein